MIVWHEYLNENFAYFSKVVGTHKDCIFAEDVLHLKLICSEIDNDAYCVCTHDFSPCTHRNIGPVRTMYAVKISGTQTVYDLICTQIKIPLKLSQNDNLSTSIVRLLCQQSKSSYNMNAASDHFILHTMQYIIHVSSVVIP